MPPGRRLLALRLVRAVHTAIFLVISSAIVFVAFAGVTGRGTRVAERAALLALAECAVILVDRGRCPLTDVAERLGAEDGRVSDIFLPSWLADRVPYLFTPPLAVGLAGLTWRRWGRWRR